MRRHSWLGLICPCLLAAGCSGNAPAVAVVVPAAAETESYEDPTYKLWSAFPVGTVVVHKQTTENENNTKKTVTTRSYLLKAKSDDGLTYQMQATLNNWDGYVQADRPTEFTVKHFGTRPKGAMDGAKPPAQAGEETVTVLGKPYKTRWQTTTEHTDAGRLTATTWSSSEIPGGLVRSVAKIPTTKSTISVEVVAVTIPKE